MLAAVTADAAGAADAAADAAAAAELAAAATQLAQKVEATAPLQLDTSALVSGGAKKASVKRLILEIKLGSTATPAVWSKADKMLLEATITRLSATALRKLLREYAHRKNGKDGLSLPAADSLGAMHDLLVDMVQHGLDGLRWPALRDSLCEGELRAAWNAVLSRHADSFFSGTLILSELITGGVPSSAALLSRLHRTAWTASQNTLTSAGDPRSRMSAIAMLYCSDSPLRRTHFNYETWEVHGLATSPPTVASTPGSPCFPVYVPRGFDETNARAAVRAGLGRLANANASSLMYTHRGVSSLLANELDDYGDMILVVDQLRKHLLMKAEKGGLTFRLMPTRLVDTIDDMSRYGAEGALLALFYRGDATEEANVNALAALGGEGRWSADMLGGERGDGTAFLYMYLSVSEDWVLPVLTEMQLQSLW